MGWAMKNLLILLLLLPIHLFAQLNEFLPESTYDDDLRFLTEYTVSYNLKNKQPNWVAYELTEAEAQLDRDRCDCFKQDKMIRTAANKDYLNSGYDRGHLSPAAHNNVSDKVNEESFNLLNICPQIPAFNRGIWKNLESWTTDQAIVYGKVFIVTGPILVKNSHVMAKTGVNKDIPVANAYFKVILRVNETKAYGVGFVIPQSIKTGALTDYMFSINVIESLTGIDFFHMMDDKAENFAESRYYKNDWEFYK